MRQINIHAAKTHLSRLVEDVARGEEIILAKAGRPIARLVPLRQTDALQAKTVEGKGPGSPVRATEAVNAATESAPETEWSDIWTGGGS